MLTGFHDFLGIFPVWSWKNTIAGSGKFCALPKKDFFFIKPGKVFRALQGYFLTMLGKGISSQRRGPGNLAEDSGLGNSNRPASPYPPGKKKKKASVAILRWSCCEEDMCCSSNKVICMMSKLANNVLNVTLNIKCPKMAPLRWVPEFSVLSCGGVWQNWTRMGPPQIFGRKIKWQKRKKPCTHLENSSTSSAEKCISSSPGTSENLPVLLCKLNLNIHFPKFI